MANARKKISELTPLISASLDTVVVGVDNGTTYKIELDVLADAVASRVNVLDRDRLSSLESITSSFESNGRSVVSSSAQITSLGFVSSSVDITSLNTFTQSIDSRVHDLESVTSSYLTSLNGTISSSAQITSFGFISQSADITPLNSFTASQSILNTAFTNGISARLQTSSFNEFSSSVHNEIVAATNEQSFNGLISGSSQLTSSYDERYVLSGSVQNIELPSNLVSGSSQLTSSYDTRYALSASFVSSSNVSSIQTITSASYAALTPVSGTLYIIIG